jgi:uncharacterized membrane protein (UPF0127 family)
MKKCLKNHQHYKFPVIVIIGGTLVVILLWFLIFWKSGFRKDRSVNKPSHNDSQTKEDSGKRLPTITKPEGLSLVVYFLRSPDKVKLLTLYGTFLEAPTPLHWLDDWSRLGYHYEDDSQVITVAFKTTKETSLDTSNLLIPVDVIWTHSRGDGDIIIDIAEKVQPKTPRIYKPAKEADHVSAIPAGFVQKYKIRIGDFVNYSD